MQCGVGLWIKGLASACVAVNSASYGSSTMTDDLHMPDQGQSSDAGQRKRRWFGIGLAVVLATVLVGIGIGIGVWVSSDEPTKGSGVASPSTTTGSKESAARSAETCDLLKPSEVKQLLGEEGVAHPGVTGGMPNCQWVAADGKYVQVIHIPSSAWARSLPEVFRVVEASGLASDPDNVRKLRQGARLVESGKKLSAAEACSMFEQMLEIQGQPPGTNSVVLVQPTHENPLAVTGQMCSDGIFTSVLIANKTQLNKTRPLAIPLPMKAIGKTTRLVHDREVG